MPELENLYHLSPRVMVARFPEDIDPNSALDPANWSIIGQDEHEVPVDQVNPAEIPFPWRDFYLHVREAFKNQEYYLTVSGITDPQGNPLGPYTWQWMPMQPVPVYPPAGIMQPRTDGEYYGQRIGIQILTKEEMIDAINGVLPDDSEYPFAQDPIDASRWTLDTADVPEPSENFKICPVPQAGHEDDFEPGELDDLFFPLIPPPWPSRIEDVLMSNETRPGAGTFYPIDTIGSKLFADADQIRGVKVLIFRPPLDPIILLPYYPPGANDPESPNYDPEAPEDGSANPDWWSLPPRPEKPLLPADPGADPSWLPLPSIIAGMWEDKLMAARPPMPPKDELWEIDLPSFKPNDHELGPGSYDLVVEVYDYENKASTRITPFEIELPLTLPGAGRISEDMFRSIKEGVYDGHFGTVTNGEIQLLTREEMVEAVKLYFELHGEPREQRFREDPSIPGLWTLDAKSLGLIEDINAEVEVTFAGTPPETSRMWFPVYESPPAALPILSFGDIEGSVVSVIDPWGFYRVGVAADGLRQGDSITLYAKYLDNDGSQKRTDLASFEAEAGWTPNQFDWILAGSVLNDAFGGYGTMARALGAEVLRAGSEESLASEIEVNAQTPHKSFEEAVKDATQEYIDADLPYDVKRKDDGKPPLTGKGTPEEISQQPGLYGQGVDCSGMYFRVLDKALRESGVEPNGMRDEFKESTRPENADTVGNWGGEDVRDDKIFEDVDPDNKDNPRIKDLEVGDAIDWDNPDGMGHVSYISEIEEVETNAHYEITIAQSASRFHGPHESTFDVPKDEYEAGESLDTVEKSDWHGDAEEQEEAHKSITDYKTSVRRLKKVDEYYSGNEGAS